MSSVKPVAAADPLWFKDAIIYQLHVRAFYDSNGDGIGDLRGLTEKLDYIQELGVTAIWLQPIFLSPLRDDGYDIADYLQINPNYGTLRDFKTLLAEAHRRDLRVITELVMNHTSDQHEWFQRARRAKPGDKWRDFYVWSDTAEPYKETRVIFQDFEASNWTWDPIAKSYFWHRFYHHQPDLNFDNPAVHQAMLDVVDFWFDLGVDGLRLDAVPYLYEREGTSCENLPETHAFLKKLRHHVDERYPDKMLLAEANQWPEDAVAYFGAGDECHMNFHFPLMPRLYMAIEREDRFPIIDIMEQTPSVPENCQWGIFLRNHDELTLEMVTDEERDYMYRTFAEDPRARVNLGIRRRLTSLLRDNRRKIELMNGLLLSLPGTPVLYYGDEIGMGDNIYLGDRDGVRTPMQWNDDRNAGFSRANPQRLYLPVIIDAPYHFASRNVEVEQSRPHSLLWWTRRLIALRKQHPAFGRGTIEFLTPENGKVLVFLREYQGETILVVANLCRFAQCAEIDLSRFRGRVPVELFGQTKFPPIGELPYFLTLGPYAFYWFQLSWVKSEQPSLDVNLPACAVVGDWDQLFEGRTLRKFESTLPAYLARHRWFAGKARTIRQTKIVDVLSIHDVPKITKELTKSAPHLIGGLPPTRLLLVRVDYVEGDEEIYALPVVFAQDNQAANLLGDHPSAGLVRVERSDGEKPAVLCDTSYEDEFWLLLFDAIAGRRTIPGRFGEVEAIRTKALARLGKTISLDVSVHGGEQSNTSAFLGNKFILKIFRRVGEGENPDLEIGRYLTEHTRLTCVPQVAGALEYRAADGDRYTLAVLHEFVANQSDAWVYTLDELDRYLERIESELAGSHPPADVLPKGASLVALAGTKPPEAAQDMIGPYLQSAALLGKRTAELHLALAAKTDDPAFKSEPFSKLYQRSLYQSMRAEARRSFTLLRRQQAHLDEAAKGKAAEVLKRESALLDRYQTIKNNPIDADRTRCHGDYHLGQVLYTGKDFVIIDFEGEPARPISARRIKTSPLRDVASMLRSLHYAAAASVLGPQRPSMLPAESAGAVTEWLSAWYVWNAAAFLGAYLEEAGRGDFLPKDRGQLEMLLSAYVLEKAVYELAYELNNRPTWVQIPLDGILRLLDAS
ncbi:MAG: maltose alpha-D-glucosyltransferase [Planctomycetota bacterium]|nr:MAG: maltose alpha-D-glucosyltransferase [Planctomycetota bacterium]